MKQPSLYKIFFTFLKIGAFTFGGGYAMLPIIREAVVTKEHWVTDDGFIDMIGITQSVPGALAVNSAIFLGYQIAGVPGALIATLGAVLPSFLIILAIATFFTEFAGHPMVIKAFNGIRPAVVALILYAVLKLGKKAIKDRFGLVVTGLALLLNIFMKINPVLLLCSAAIAGLLYGKLSTHANACACARVHAHTQESASSIEEQDKQS